MVHVMPVLKKLWELTLCLAHGEFLISVCCGHESSRYFSCCLLACWWRPFPSEPLSSLQAPLLCVAHVGRRAGIAPSASSPLHIHSYLSTQLCGPHLFLWGFPLGSAVPLGVWRVAGDRDWGIFHRSSLPAGLGWQRLSTSRKSQLLCGGSHRELQLWQCGFH